MTTPQQTENVYITEIKSLLQDKFFMLLLGISVAIVLMSTVYSIVKPKTNGDLASGAQTQAVTQAPSGSLQEGETSYEETAEIAGLEAVEGTQPNTSPSPSRSLFDAIREKASSIFGGASETTPPTTPQEPESEATQPASSPRKGQSYTVKEGDNLWVIAESVYSSGYNFVDIASLNAITNPDYIEVGQVIKIPDVEAKTPTLGDITPDAAMTRSDASVKPSHTVSEGESLWLIAQAEYSDPYQWTHIVELNPTITNPDFITPGQVLKLK